MYWRNFGEWITSRTRVKVEWSRYLFDLRIGFQSGGKWKICRFAVWKPVTQNFWNAVFSVNVYVVKTVLWGVIPALLPRIGIVSRFSRDWWFEAGIGYLFDRGEFGAKLTLQNWNIEEQLNPGCNAVGWNEGPV